MPLRSDQIREGRYLMGGEADTTAQTIDWWEGVIFPKSPSDVEVIVTPKYAGRPWLLAHDAYGKAWLEWFVLYYNNIVDTNEEFIEGKAILLPTAQRLFQELLSRSPAAAASIKRR